MEKQEELEKQIQISEAEIPLALPTYPSAFIGDNDGTVVIGVTRRVLNDAQFNHFYGDNK